MFKGLYGRPFPWLAVLLCFLFDAVLAPGTSRAEKMIIHVQQFEIKNAAEGLDLTEAEITAYLVETLGNRDDLHLYVGSMQQKVRIDYDLQAIIEWMEPGPEGHHLDLKLELLNSQKAESVRRASKLDLSLIEGQVAIDNFMRDLRGRLRVECVNYEGAKVQVDHTATTAPFDSVGILLGTYSITVSHAPEAIEDHRSVSLTNSSPVTEKFKLLEKPTLLTIKTANGKGQVFLDGVQAPKVYKTYAREVIKLRVRPYNEGSTIRKRLILEKHQDYDIVVDLDRGILTGSHVPRVIGPRRPFLHTSMYIGLGYSLAIPEDTGLKENFTAFHNISCDVGMCMGLFSGQVSFWGGIPQKNFSGLSFLDGAQEEQEITSLYRIGTDLEGRFILPLGWVGDNAVYPFVGVGYAWTWYVAYADKWTGADGEYNESGDPGMKIESFYPYWTCGINIGQVAFLARVSILDPSEYESNWVEVGVTWNFGEEVKE